ncbi:MAG TPA: hypothetical protein VGL70_05300 [Candidatus Binatia bacterium]|jgi:hypothetical protein
MTKGVEELARQIASLEESDLQTLLDRVEELSLRHNIEALSDPSLAEFHPPKTIC